MDKGLIDIAQEVFMYFPEKYKTISYHLPVPKHTEKEMHIIVMNCGEGGVQVYWQGKEWAVVYLNSKCIFKWKDNSWLMTRVNF